MKTGIWQIALICPLCLNDVYLPQLNVASESKMIDEQWLQNAAKDFTRPWSERRGIESIDRNAEVILVRVPLNELSDALAAQAVEVRRDVLGSEIEVVGAFVFAYQLVGHAWSIMVRARVWRASDISVLRSSGLAQLSRQLKQPVIRLLVSDTGGKIGYDLFENGELVEYFRGAEENEVDDMNEYGIQPKRYEWFPSPDELYEDDDPNVPEQIVDFWSRRRQVVMEEMKSIWSFARQLMCEYDAFDPAIDDSYLLGNYTKLEQGKRYQVQNPGFTLNLGYDRNGQKREVTSVPDLVRVDYFRFRN